LVRLLDLPTSSDFNAHLAKISVILETAAKITVESFASVVSDKTIQF
jgi:hypothetical protein